MTGEGAGGAKICRDGSIVAETDRGREEDGKGREGRG